MNDWQIADSIKPWKLYKLEASLASKSEPIWLRNWSLNFDWIDDWVALCPPTIHHGLAEMKLWPRHQDIQAAAQADLKLSLLDTTTMI